MEFNKFKDIIQFAIEREEEAAEAYGNMSEKALDQGLKELLLELKEEEINHKNLLEDISKEKIESLEVSSVIDLKISDYLVEEPPGTDMTFQDLLIFAAKKEQKASELYSSLGQKANSEELKKLFDFLVEQEKKHKLKLEIWYEKHVLAED